jgi:hypothetical protein
VTQQVDDAAELDLTRYIRPAVITGAHKSADRGLTVTGLLLGTSTLISRAAVDKSIQLRGAARSAGGIPVIALPSTTERSAALPSTTGTASRIVAWLSGPAGLSRADVGVIVTEYGVADLRGLSLARRRERMIAIAHPDYRAALESAAAD